jgi:sortase A
LEVYCARKHLDMKLGSVWLRRLEWALLIAGLILLTVYVGVRGYGEISSRLAIRKFKSEQSLALRNSQEPVRSNTGQKIDVSLWSEQRVRDYKASLGENSDSPLALLRVPKLQLEVPVFDGTDELTLNRGAGRIIGTARLGQVGNTGIAGHRDGFFRGLKDIQTGDTLELDLSGRTETYAVTSIEITTPDDVSVLKPTPVASITLVTCYPFYFVGSAPQRFIVHASANNPDAFQNKSTNNAHLEGPKVE